jgi:hypothetical protein
MTEAEREALYRFKLLMRDAGVDVSGRTDDQLLDRFYLMLEYQKEHDEGMRELDEIFTRVQGLFKGPTINRALLGPDNLAKDVLEAEIEAFMQRQSVKQIPPRPPGYFNKLFGDEQ